MRKHKQDKIKQIQKNKKERKNEWMIEKESEKETKQNDMKTMWKLTWGDRVVYQIASHIHSPVNKLQANTGTRATTTSVRCRNKIDA